jgi:hypothetical protein
MRMLPLVVSMAVLAAGPSAAFAQANVMTPVHQFVDAFNKGDTRAAAAACSGETSIIDEFPPHEWHGTGACLAWMGDYDANARQNGITDGFVALGKPTHVDITGNRAYVVIPANYTYRQRGKSVRETASMMAFALRKSDAGWLITGWSWAKR